MNFKRNLYLIITALVGALAISGCDLTGPAKFEHFSFINEISDSHEDVIGEGYIKFGDYDSYKTNVTKGPNEELGSAYEVFRDYGETARIPSEGEQKLIVIPVSFPDYGVDKLGITKEQFIDDVNKAFFGKAANNKYVSVCEYLNKSSYGKLKLDGKVCDKFFEFDKTTTEIIESKLKRDVLATEYYKKIIEWYKENYDDLDDYKIADLKDNANVPIYLVYTYPIGEDRSDDTENFFWAYTFQERPLSWSSYSFMYMKYGEPDAHTYIHETSHLLGLVDYYPTTNPKEEETVKIEPTSRIDMMDCSIGDHTGFSKMFLNWVRPYYITDSCEIQISSFTETGDLILLCNKWNRTVFDEYYLIELYTPTNLNTFDVSVGNSESKLPRFPGIKIYHVDARLGYFYNGLSTMIDYCSEGGFNPTSHRIGFAHDNNTYDEPLDYQKNYLYQLVLNNNKDVQTFCANDTNLYRMNDTIPLLKLNSGGEIGFNISIETMNFNQAVLMFEKY